MDHRKRILEGEFMSRQITFASAPSVIETDTNSAATNIRLNSLRDAALTILGELDSLEVATPPPPTSSSCSLRLYDEVRKFEINLIRSALSRTGGSQTNAAKLLGVKLTTLNSKIKRYRIESFTYDLQDQRMAEESAA